MSGQVTDQAHRNCLTCRCHKRPGLAEPGYCGERTDTPPAYGADHPLHHLPEDGGVSCSKFEGRA